MAKSFKCSVITPEGTVFDGDAEFVAIPAYDGELGILRDRAPLLAKLGAGELRVETQGQRQSWFIEGGFAQVLDNVVSVLTQKAIAPDRIDVEKASAQLQEAHGMKTTDDVAAKRKAAMEASARAQLRMAR